MIMINQKNQPDEFGDIQTDMHIQLHLFEGYMVSCLVKKLARKHLKLVIKLLFCL